MKSKRSSLGRRGFSLVEILVVVSVIGVLSAIAIPAYSGLTESTRRTESEDFVESLNRAVRTFGQCNWDLKTTPDAAATTDEFLVLRSLQYRRSPMPSPGSPYFDGRYNPATSSDSSTYRIRWNGTTFEVLRPGTAGTGLLKKFDGTDRAATTYAFPADYAPVAPQ